MSEEFKEALIALRTSAETLNNLADVIEKVLAEAVSSREDKTTVEETVKEETKELSMADVKAMLTSKSRAGYTKEVKALLKKYGADKLSAIDESNYQALYAEAEVIGDE